MLFSYEGNLLHVESDEARRQITRQNARTRTRNSKPSIEVAVEVSGIV